MAKTKKSLSDKETELLNIISDAKKKLAKLQEKQKIDIGDLACQHGLNKFDINVLGIEFKKLSEQLSISK